MPAALVLATIGLTAPARAFEAEKFEAQIGALSQDPDPEAAARKLDVLAAEAWQAGRVDLQLLAETARARAKIKARQPAGVRESLEEWLATARQLGLASSEALLGEALAEYWLSQDDPGKAAEALEHSWPQALGKTAAGHDLAERLLERLTELYVSMGQMHLARQCDAWLALLADDADAPAAGVTLQPASAAIQVATDEVARTRIFLANASLAPVTGTLLIDGGDLAVSAWAAKSTGETITLRFPAASPSVPASTAQGRKITLQPGESRVLTVELEPNAPPRLASKTVSLTWQTPHSTTTAEAHFHFRRAKDFPSTSVASTCQVRLNPLLSVPVYMEVYRRGEMLRHVQDVLPATSRPCRVELYEILPHAARQREWLALDADGDGVFETASDAVLSDRDGSGYPDISFSAGKPVAALEIRLYPLPSADGSAAEDMDLTLTLRDGTTWRQPPDAVNRVEP